MMFHCPDLGGASGWSYREGILLQPIKSTNQIYVVTRHQYRNVAVFSGYFITITLFTLVKVILRSITDSSRPSHHCRRTTNGLDRGHCRQLTHEKDSALLLDESCSVHKPRVEASTRNSASVPLKRKASSSKTCYGVRAPH